MQLYLDSYGAFLGVRNGMFYVKPRYGEGQALPLRQVKAIFLCRGVRVSTDALELAIRSGIPVLLTDGIGRPLGQVWSGQFGSIATIRKNQALFSLSLAGLRYVAGLLRRRAEGQLQVLSRLKEQYRIAEEGWERGVEVIQGIMERHKQVKAVADKEALKQSLRGWEGTATRHYFQLLATALPPQYAFNGRSKRPAYDPFNALLNYLYGMLYPMVELAQMKAGLDPYAGILHADEYNRPTLVFDMIEPYRHWAEWVAVRLCRDGLLPPDAFEDSEREGFWLARPGKSVVIDAFLQYLDEKVSLQGSLRRRATHIDLDAMRLAGALREMDPPDGPPSGGP
ncbi:MAG: CRISPR-associated endonuclease Cas1 [Phaeodactylibacter sp.]|nr:CRISPR-associated endonuclease Cas1 [Phaeodactylibacter sp.]